jgi:hypothetical protein
MPHQANQTKWDSQLTDPVSYKDNVQIFAEQTTDLLPMVTERVSTNQVTEYQR